MNMAVACRANFPARKRNATSIERVPTFYCSKQRDRNSSFLAPKRRINVASTSVSIPRTSPCRRGGNYQTWLVDVGVKMIFAGLICTEKAIKFSTHRPSVHNYLHRWLVIGWTGTRKGTAIQSATDCR